MTNKTLGKVAEMGKKSAIQTGMIFSRYFLHQPKTPAKVLEMAKQAKK